MNYIMKNPLDSKEARTLKYKTKTVKAKKDKDSFKRLKNVMTDAENDEWVNKFVEAYMETL